MQFSFVPGFSQSKSSFSNTSPGKLSLLKYASLKRYLWIPRPSSASFQITGGRRNSVFCPFSPRDHFSEFHEAIHKDAQTTVQRLWRFFARVIRSTLAPPRLTQLDIYQESWCTCKTNARLVNGLFEIHDLILNRETCSRDDSSVKISSISKFTRREKKKEKIGEEHDGLQIRIR